MRVFDEEWFDRHQADLLAVLRYRALQSLILGFDHPEPVVEVGPSHVVRDLGDGRFRGEFCVEPLFANLLRRRLHPLWTVMHVADWLVLDRWLPKWSFGFWTFDTWIVSAPNTTTDSAQVYRATVANTWTTYCTGTGTSTQRTGTDAVGGGCSTTSNQFTNLYRAFFTFDTRSLRTTRITVSGGKVSVTSIANSQGGPNDLPITVYGCAPAANNNLVASDYQTALGTALSNTTKLFSDYNTSTGLYMDFPLNASGIAAVVPGGITPMCMRTTNDVSQTQPTWLSSAFFYGQHRGSGVRGPRLFVDYAYNESEYGDPNQVSVRPRAFAPGLAR